MKMIFFTIILCFCISLNITAQNKYLVKTKTEGDKTVYYTKEGLFDKVYSSSYPHNLIGVYVNLKNINLSKAEIDTTGYFETILGQNGMPACVINYYGRAKTPAIYTITQNADYYNPILGRKLKNGLWEVSLVSMGNNEEYKVHHILGANKDYMRVNDLLMFQTVEGNYGLVDIESKIIVEPKFTTIKFISDKATFYNKSYSKYKSLEETFQTGLVFNDNAMDGSLKGVEFSGESSKLLYFSKEIYPDYRKFSKHTLNRSGQFDIDFYFIEDKDGNSIFKSSYVKELMNEYQYAFMEQVRRDTTPGENKYWEVVSGVDYSKPFDLQKFDSIKAMENAYTYVNLVKGTYKILSWEEPNGAKFFDMGIGKNKFHFKVKDTEHVSLDIDFSGVNSFFVPDQSIGYTVHIDNLNIAPGKIGLLKDNVGLLVSRPQNAKFVNEKGKIEEIWGEYNWKTAELMLQFNVAGYPGTFTIKAKHINTN